MRASFILKSLSVVSTSKFQTHIRTPTFAFVRNSTHTSFPNEDLKQRVNQEFLKSRKRIITIPNILTVSRVATAPAISYFILNGMHGQALACFAFAAATDLLDGLIARVFAQGSELGAILDPIADKILLITCFVSLANAGLVPVWLVKGFLLRDVILLAGGAAIRYSAFMEKPTMRQFFDIRNYPTTGLDPTRLSKVNTALQCLLIILHLGGSQLIGYPMSDLHLKILQFVTCATTSGSLMQYMLRPILDSQKLKVIKNKGL